MPKPRKLATLGRSLLAGAMLALAAAHAGAGEFPDEWYFTDAEGERLEEHVAFEGNAAPPLTVADWVGGELTPEDMEGKILVIDFWATWSQRSIAGIPQNNNLAQTYADEGVIVMGVCTGGDPEQMAELLEQNDASYPSAFAQGDQVATDWPLIFFPTYAVIDGTGTVRAIGIQPNAITQVVDALLEEQAENTGRARIPRQWLEGDEASRDRLRKLERNADDPPALDVDTWVNTETEDGLTEDDLAGKVVLLSFGATWAPPWLEAIEELNALHEEFAEDGLVVIGICATLEGFALPEVAEQYGIAFPACVDRDNRTNRAFGPNGFPDYYLLDRAGHLRIADLKHDHVRDAVEALLAEEPPEVTDPEDEVPENNGETDDDAAESIDNDGADETASE